MKVRNLHKDKHILKYNFELNTIEPRARIVIKCIVLNISSISYKTCGWYKIMHSYVTCPSECQLFSIVATNRVGWIYAYIKFRTYVLNLGKAPLHCNVFGNLQNNYNHCKCNTMTWKKISTPLIALDCILVYMWCRVQLKVWMLITTTQAYE